MAAVKAAKISSYIGAMYLNISKPKSLKPKSPQPNLLLDKIQEQQARNAVREITNTDARNGGKITEALRAYTLPRRNG